MIYVTSDLHGLEITKLKALLKKACFNENDRLFVLGDVIDRQNDGGVAILIWLSEQPNTQLILGNHEAMLLSCDFVFNEITEESIKHFDKEQTELLNNYMLQYYRLSERSAALRNRDRRRKEFSALSFRTR